MTKERRKNTKGLAKHSSYSYFERTTYITERRTKREKVVRIYGLRDRKISEIRFSFVRRSASTI